MTEFEFSSDLREMFAKMQDAEWRAAHSRTAPPGMLHMAVEPSEEQRREAAMRRAGIPPLYRSVVPATSVPERGRLYVGRAGVGKTHAAIADLLAFSANGHKALFLSLPAYMAALRSREDVPSIRALTELDVVVLDDIAQAKPPEWMRDSLYALIDGLLSYRVFVIATSNQSRRDIAAAYGDPIASRLYALCPDLTEVTGRDRRLHGGAS